MCLSLWACAGGSGLEGGGPGEIQGGAQGAAVPTQNEGEVAPKWDPNPKLKVEGNSAAANQHSEDSYLTNNGPSPPGGRPPFPGELEDSNTNNGDNPDGDADSPPAPIRIPGKH